MPFRPLRRLVRGVVGVPLVLVALVAASIPLDGLIGPGRVGALTSARVPGPAGDVRVYVARPSVLKQAASPR